MSDAPESTDLACDFCGKSTEAVRRVALDTDYDRLQRPHKERYACAECSEKKERERAGAGQVRE